MAAMIPWWGWLLIALGCWLIQLILSVPTESGSKSAALIRFGFIAGMLLSALIALIRFMRWV